MSRARRRLQLGSGKKRDSLIAIVGAASKNEHRLRSERNLTEKIRDFFFLTSPSSFPFSILSSFEIRKKKTVRSARIHQFSQWVRKREEQHVLNPFGGGSIRFVHAHNAGFTTGSPPHFSFFLFSHFEFEFRIHLRRLGSFKLRIFPFFWFLLKTRASLLKLRTMK